MTVSLDVDGIGPTLFCHATPRRDDEFVLVDSPMELWRAALNGVVEQTVVVGQSTSSNRTATPCREFPPPTGELACS